jgi:ketosteroid isomerase-like protein
MASANVEFVRSIFADWEPGDFSSAEWAHPEIQFVLTGGPAEGGWTGVRGMAQGFRGWLSVWEEYRVEVDEWRELDGERVLAFFQSSGRGKTSGLELGQMRSEGAALFHVRGRKVTRLVIYADREGAFADLGLAPKA